MTELAALTSEQARLLRNANDVCFDSTFRPGAGDGHEWGIRALIDANDRTGEGQRTIRIPVETARLERFRQETGEDADQFDCFAMIMTAQYSPHWQTIARQIKKGSVISMRWTRNNQSPVLDEVGFCHDMLDIEVRNGPVKNVYRVAYYIGHDNTARLIRRRSRR